MELPWVMRKALRLVSELQARQAQRCARDAVTLISARPRFQPARSRRRRAAQIRHNEAEFATCLRAGIINVAETYSLKGTRPRGHSSDVPFDGNTARHTAWTHAYRALSAIALTSRRADAQKSSTG
jgi:hypothetical protein